jgi:hypothetical protein
MKKERILKRKRGKMARNKESLYDIPTNIADIVRLMCADYDRRAYDIMKRSREEKVITKYTELNSVIDGALTEVEYGIRRELLDDIGLGRGYDLSPLSPLMAKNTYYKRKKAVVTGIAERLDLI